MNSERKVLDAFMFFNEIEIARARILYLAAEVDRFLVIELGVTHAGIVREPEFEKVLSGLPKDVRARIDYRLLTGEDVCLGMGVSPEQIKLIDRWAIENFHRSLIDVCCDSLGDDDVVVISDLDEVPCVSAIRILRRAPLLLPIALGLTMFQFSLEFQEARAWRGPVATRKALLLRRGAQWHRNRRMHFSWMTNAGWHFSSFGGLERVRYKAANLAHSELSEISKQDFELERRILEGRSLYEQSPFPSEIRETEALDEGLLPLIHIDPVFFGQPTLALRPKREAVLCRASFWNLTRVFFWLSYRKRPYFAQRRIKREDRDEL